MCPGYFIHLDAQLTALQRASIFLSKLINNRAHFITNPIHMFIHLFHLNVVKIWSKYLFTNCMLIIRQSYRLLTMALNFTGPILAHACRSFWLTSSIVDWQGQSNKNVIHIFIPFRLSLSTEASKVLVHPPENVIMQHV